MSKLVRKFALLIGAAALVAAAPVNALAGLSKQSKNWAGPSGSTACGFYALGQSFIAGSGDTYEVTVAPVAGKGDVQARLWFFVNGTMEEAEDSPFINKSSGLVPAGATEAWVTICHTNPEVSYGPVIVTVPVTIEYTEK